MASAGTASRAPWLVLRAEYDEWDFITENPALFDAVLVPEGYLAEFPKGHHLHDKDRDRLLKAAAAKDRPVWRDPETAGLRSRTIETLRPSDRRLATPAARALGGARLEPARLRDPAFLEHFVDSCLEAQSGAGILAAPYLDFRGLDDLCFQLNLRMARRAVAAAGSAPATAFVQITNHRLLSGVAAAAAPHYARTGVRHVVIRVRDLGAQTASRPELAAYLDAIEAFTAADLDVTADCTGRLGPILVAGGAGGFSTGTRFFKKVAYPLLSRRDGGGGGGEKIGREVAGSWDEVDRGEAVSAGDARVANLRDLRTTMLLAARDPEALIASLRSAGQRYAREWAAELEERRALAA